MVCFFGGLTQAEAGRQLGFSSASAERLWAFVLGRHREMKKQLDLSAKGLLTGSSFPTCAQFF